MINERLANSIERCTFLKDEPMSRHTSFSTGGNADYMFVPGDEPALFSVLDFLKGEDVPVYIIGKGTNLLVSDRGVRGAVIKISYGQPAIDGEKISAPAGASLKSIAYMAAQNGLAGPECLAGIPGTLGGGIAMNAGAYGGEISDFISRIRLLGSNGAILTLGRDDMDFGYRHSIVSNGGYTVLSADFILKKGNAQRCLDKIEDLAVQRRLKQPLKYKSAGSTFKRPKSHYAGQLIELAGLKGKRIGGAEVSKKHAGFIINKENASSSDIYALMLLVQKIVKDQTGVFLEPELTILGDFDID